MYTQPLPEHLPAPLRDAMQARGYTQLTAVQSAVLDADAADRDLRISSQTGSGKTVALGFALARVFAPLAPNSPQAGEGKKVPRAFVITPTRELAAQVRSELDWLYTKLGVRVTVVTGGSSVRGELRELARGADVIVGTPGRLCDHIERGAIITKSVAAVVLDEADQMLDLGFREALTTILDALPAERNTHLVSATFSREVTSLANKYQNDPLAVEGTKLGAANADIEHVAHVVPEKDRANALVNLLLLAPSEQALVFVRLRSDTATFARQLTDAGFNAAALSGDMEQKERSRTLAQFRSGALRCLVATDVAARGLDIKNVARVIHVDPPTDPDSYTHRSGRTGRAGTKGQSVILVPPSNRERVNRLLGAAKVKVSWRPLPTAEELFARADERLYSTLTHTHDGDTEAPAPRLRKLAMRILSDADPLTVMVRALAIVEKSEPMPRPVTVVNVPDASTRSPFKTRARPRDRDDSAPTVEAGYVPFVVKWGSEQGADPRRLLALLCRRGGVQGKDIGAIRVDARQSHVDVAAHVANAFEQAVRKPDPEGRPVYIDRVDGHPGDAKSAPRRPGRFVRDTRFDRRDAKPLRGGGPLVAGDNATFSKPKKKRQEPAFTSDRRG